MSGPIRRELDLARLAARERRLRLVMDILGQRAAEYGRAHQPTPRALRQSIADFGQQLGDVRRRQTALQDAPDVSGRFTPRRPERYVPGAS